MRTVKGLSLVYLVVVAGTAGLVGCGTGKSKPGTADSNSFNVIVVLPKISAGISLASPEVSSVTHTAYDETGMEISSASVPVETDADGIKTASLSLNPNYSSTVEEVNYGLGAIIAAPGEAPSQQNIQIPMTSAAKNAVDAMKSIPPEMRVHFDADAATTLLPAGVKYDASTMKSMIITMVQMYSEIPADKRKELSRKQLEAQTVDYRDIAKKSGDFQTADVSTVAAAKQSFIAANPNLANSTAAKFMTDPLSELTSVNSSISAQIPASVKGKVMGDTLARSFVMGKVKENNGQPLTAEQLAALKPALTSVKASVEAARYGDGGGDTKMQSMLTTLKAAIFDTSGQLKPIDPSTFATSVAAMATQVGVNSNDLTSYQKTISDGQLSYNPPPTSTTQPGSTPICAMVIKNFINIVGECRVSYDSCMASVLESKGYRERTSSDVCKF